MRDVHLGQRRPFRQIKKSTVACSESRLIGRLLSLFFVFGGWGVFKLLGVSRTLSSVCTLTRRPPTKRGRRAVRARKRTLRDIVRWARPNAEGGANGRGLHMLFTSFGFHHRYVDDDASLSNRVQWFPPSAWRCPPFAKACTQVCLRLRSCPAAEARRHGGNQVYDQTAPSSSMLLLRTRPSEKK